MVETIFALQPVHPLHYLTPHIAQLQHEASVQVRNAAGVLASARLREGAWDVLHGHLQRERASSLENLGDALLLPEGEEAVPEEQLVEAHKSFKRALGMMTVV